MIICIHTGGFILYFYPSWVDGSFIWIEKKVIIKIKFNQGIRWKFMGYSYCFLSVQFSFILKDFKCCIIFVYAMIFFVYIRKSNLIFFVLRYHVM